MVRFFHVTRTFSDNRVALNDVTFQMKDGELLTVVGPSGAGKSTLLKMVYMEEMPNSGQVIVGGFLSSLHKTARVLQNPANSPSGLSFTGRWTWPRLRLWRILFVRKRKHRDGLLSTNWPGRCQKNSKR